MICDFLPLGFGRLDFGFWQSTFLGTPSGLLAIVSHSDHSHSDLEGQFGWQIIFECFWFDLRRQTGLKSETKISSGYTFGCTSLFHVQFSQYTIQCRSCWTITGLRIFVLHLRMYLLHCTSWNSKIKGTSKIVVRPEYSTLQQLSNLLDTSKVQPGICIETNSRQSLEWANRESINVLHTTLHSQDKKLMIKNNNLRLNSN